MKHYKIKKGQEMPKSVRCLGNFCPFEFMEEGDSFSFAIGDGKRVQSLADAYGKKHNQAFAMAYGEDDGTIWRIS